MSDVKAFSLSDSVTSYRTCMCTSLLVVLSNKHPTCWLNLVVTLAFPGSVPKCAPYYSRVFLGLRPGDCSINHWQVTRSHLTTTWAFRSVLQIITVLPSEPGFVGTPSKGECKKYIHIPELLPEATLPRQSIEDASHV